MRYRIAAPPRITEPLSSPHRQNSRAYSVKKPFSSWSQIRYAGTAEKQSSHKKKGLRSSMFVASLTSSSACGLKTGGWKNQMYRALTFVKTLLRDGRYRSPLAQFGEYTVACLHLRSCILLHGFLVV